MAEDAGHWAEVPGVDPTHCGTVSCRCADLTFNRISSFSQSSCSFKGHNIRELYGWFQTRSLCANMAANIPAKLKNADIVRFVHRATQLEKFKPVISYWCRRATSKANADIC